MKLNDLKKVLLVVAGPTAAGKTALAIQLAKYFKTEILSADSRQFYKEMSIGTAKPSAEELAAVPHHFIGSHSITDRFSVADFEKAALEKLAELYQKHDVAIIVGGSGLYLQAVEQGFDEIPEADLQERERWNQLYEQQGLEYLQQQLKILDPEYYQKVDVQNPQRIIRALEVSSSTGKTFSSFLTKIKKERPFKIIKIGINPNRKILYDMINRRVDLMVENGLIEEVKQLLPYQHLNALKTVGYKELFEAFNNNLPVKEALEKIKQNTRHFAKRQITWFKKDEEIKWFDSADVKPVLDYILPLIG
ncbi:tRNA (adenosine(37)-N6)-dimethylallyltransferase MiaA [Mucilaginibacter arboris]|uniref:tRNA (adenosine(37)-N6)-dimethylallyltransferase MiaA n=1 Tax=Mucilaginibacter arboris TaxID=2682090 RepID=UPI00293BA99D|nr:tRNA (adenosine(37)-N6)-dimethylallyltransferase MiaA [Mucilaginibacter arboris]